MVVLYGDTVKRWVVGIRGWAGRWMLRKRCAEVNIRDLQQRRERSCFILQVAHYVREHGRIEVKARVRAVVITPWHCL